MRTIGYINWKGGVGKTTLAINTAYALGEYLDKLRVLFIDTDKQGNASTWFDADPERPTLTDILRRAEPIEKVIQPTRYEHIDLIAADASLLDINIEILRDPKGRQDNILKEALKPVAGRYDICIIDNPPDSNIPVLNGLTLVNDLIAVTLPNQFSLDGIEELQAEIDNYNHLLGLSLSILGVVVNQHTPFDSAVCETLQKRYRLLPCIRRGRNTQRWLDRVINEKKSIYELSPLSAYAHDITQLVTALAELIKASYTQL